MGISISMNILREERGERADSIEFVEEFDKAETVRNLFYLAELDMKELDEVKESPQNVSNFLMQQVTD